MSISPSVVLLVFCLYLLVRWEKVKRPLFFLIGAGGIAIVLLSTIFAVGDNRAVHTIMAVFTWLGTIIAFVGLGTACYGGKLPVEIPGDRTEE